MNKNQKTNELNCRKHIANVVGADGSVRPQKQNGITLIALVITIIVMLILVAVTITIAINGGLFGMAKKAKANTEEELAKENVLSTGRVKIDGTWYDSMEDYVNGNESKNQMLSYKDTPKDGENETLTDNALWTEENGKTAVIPKGFKVVAGIDGNQSIDSGLVIEDAKGNEFVWIPVNYTAKGELDDHGLDKGFLEVFYRSDWSGNVRIAGLSSDYTEPYASGYKEEDTEYYAMMKSVQKNGGFYIGRYEAGSIEPRIETSEDTTMVVKRDQYPYNWVGWGSSMSDIESPIKNSAHGAVYLSKNMYKEGDNVGVVSTLCYGVEWDAMLDFIKDESHSVTDSTEWGNYKNNNEKWTIDRTEAKSSKYNYDGESGKLGEWKAIPDDGLTKTSSEEMYLLTTGASDVFSAKNIYDIAGNCYEWTMEMGSTNGRAVRGCSYGSDGSSNPASFRYGSYPSYMIDDVSFRPALYIKN